MTGKNKKHSKNYLLLARLFASQNVIIVHPEQDIITKIEKKLEKTR